MSDQTKETKPQSPEKSAPGKAAPTVEVIGKFEPGQSVKHANGNEYEVRYQTAEGVALVGVANLVHPSALTLK
jgi:hypothetical protein